jgi:hypothetical protein
MNDSAVKKKPTLIYSLAPLTSVSESVGRHVSFLLFNSVVQSGDKVGKQWRYSRVH